MSAPISLRSVGDAVFAAADLLEQAEKEAEAASTARDAQEKAALIRTLGLEGEESLFPQPCAARSKPWKTTRNVVLNAL